MDKSEIQDMCARLGMGLGKVPRGSFPRAKTWLRAGFQTSGRTNNLPRQRLLLVPIIDRTERDRHRVPLADATRAE